MRLQSWLDDLARLQQRHALLLFLALGALLFTVDGLRRREPPLVVPASAGEGASAEQWLEDEVLYREALARGLGENDLIVRRRLVQKMRQLLETGVEVTEPSEAQLRDWIDAHAGRYGALQRLSLDHVFLSRSRYGADLPAAARRAAEALTRGDAELSALADPHPAGTRLERLDTRSLERIFGAALVEQFGALPLDRWEGPLASSLGLHLVRLRAREARAPDHAAVRERALRDYLVEHRREATQAALAQLKSRHGLVAATP